MSRPTAFDPAERVGPGAVPALALFAALWLVCYVCVFMTGALLGPIKQDLSLPDEQLGRLHVAYVLAFVATTPVAGWLGDRYARKPLLLGGIWLLCLAAVGCGSAGSLFALCAWRAVAGVGEGIFMALSPSWLADLFPQRKRGVVFAILFSTGQFAAWIAYAGGTWISGAYSWHWSFGLTALPPALLSLVLLLLREPRPAHRDQAAPAVADDGAKDGIRWLLRQPDYLIYIAGYMFRMVGVGGLFYWAGQLLSRYWPIANGSAVSFVGSAYVLTGVPAILLAGYLGGKLSVRSRGSYLYFLIGGDLLAGLATLVLLQFPLTIAGAKTVFLLVVMFAGFAWGAITPVIYEVVPVALRNSAMALALAASNIGSALIGSQLVGVASDLSDLRTGMLVIPIAYLLSGILWIALLWRRRTAPREDAPIQSVLV